MLERLSRKPASRSNAVSAMSRRSKPTAERLETRTLLTGTNLIANGNFESGNTGFSTEYTYSPGNIGPAASYDVVDDPAHDRPNDINPVSYGDHTTGTGLMMAVNGSSNIDQTVWSETITVTPNTEYDFSLWISSWFAGSPATLSIQFNGTSIGTPAAPSTVATWQEFATTWNSGSTTSLTINIFDTNPADVGSDFAMDDISLATPTPGQIQFSPTNYTVSENAGTINLTVTRSGGSDGSVTVAYATANGTAAAGSRYTAASGTLTFAPGQTQESIAISIINDDLVWPDLQGFTVTIQNPTGGATLGSQTVATVGVQQDNLPQVPNSTPTLSALEAAASDIAKSTEHYQEFVTSEYALFLGRQPDSQGLSYWVGQMQLYESSNHSHGLRQEDIQADFIDSPEYLGRFGGVNSAWIQGIYNDLLNRQADSAGLQFWLAKLNAGVAPITIAESFTDSNEQLTNVITNSYETLFGRMPDSQGLAYWLAVFNAGGTVEDINAGFVGSLEYYDQTNGAAGNPARWVRQAYLDLLFRPPATGEENSWLAFLSN